MEFLKAIIYNFFYDLFEQLVMSREALLFLQLPMDLAMSCSCWFHFFFLTIKLFARCSNAFFFFHRWSFYHEVKIGQSRKTHCTTWQTCSAPFFYSLDDEINYSIKIFNGITFIAVASWFTSLSNPQRVEKVLLSTPNNISISGASLGRWKIISRMSKILRHLLVDLYHSTTNFQK